MNIKQLLVVSSITVLTALSLNAHALTFTGPTISDTDGDGTITSEEVQTAVSEYYASIVSAISPSPSTLILAP